MIIRIGTDRFWVKASNIERWPEILNVLPENIACKSKKGIAEDYLHYTIDSHGRIVNADEVYGLFGLERGKSSITISGCNFIKESQGGYILTSNALRLVELYRSNGPWEKVLGQQLLKYCIRVRSIAFALLNGGFLCFDSGYMENLVNSYIDFKGNKYFIFSDKPGDTNMNSLVNDFSNASLGLFWEKEIGVDEDEKFLFKGINKEYPSLGSMSTYLKIPLMLFEHLKWIIEISNKFYAFDKQQLKRDIDEETYKSLVCEDSLHEFEILKQLIKENTDARGFFPIGIVGLLLKGKIDSQNNMPDEQWIDHYFVTGISNGNFKIVEHEQGQPRHGRGLTGRKEYQLLKMKFYK